MSKLEDARRRWLKEQPQHEEFGRVLSGRIRAALQPLGIWFDVDYRAKQVDSLIKKLIKKRKHTYDSLPDKVGVRVTVRYRSELESVVQAISSEFPFSKVDYKDRPYDSIGYLSIHIDKVSLKRDDPDRRRYPATRFWAEVQIRTRAQHLWSEMSHDSIYKNDEAISELPNEIQRRVHLMAGQLEIADREFDRLAKDMPTSPATELLRMLEPYYFSFTSRRPDYELSLDILEVIAPLYGHEIALAKDHLKKFLDRKRTFLSKLYSIKQQPGATNVSPLFFQPEALAIYERLKVDTVALRSAWTRQFPESELEELASTFGINPE